MTEKKILVIDDEKAARERILGFLRKRRDAFVLSEAENGLEGLDRIRDLKPDLIFLDIEMPGLGGLEMLQQLEERPFQVIFQTAFDRFAIQAFEQNACDYLLKPFPEERFNQALDRALKALHDSALLDRLESSFRDQERYLEQIVVRQGSKLIPIPISEIECFLSRDHYTCLYTGGNQAKEHITELSLERLEERLAPRDFKRLHRNNIVRLDRIRSVVTGENAKVLLSNGMELPVSRNHRKTLKDLGLL